MSLKSKAKEVREYWQHNPMDKNHNWSTKVVTLVDAQKEIAHEMFLRKDAYRVRDGYIKTVSELEAKIEAAKPLLENWCKECGESEYENTCENDCCVHDLKALLFPRKEEDEK